MIRLATLKPPVARLEYGMVGTLTVKRITGRVLQSRNRRLLAREPLCRACVEQCKVTAAVQVDHIVPLHLGGSEDESNLQGLCLKCHDAKSAKEAKNRGTGGI